MTDRQARKHRGEFSNTPPLKIIIVGAISASALIACNRTPVGNLPSISNTQAVASTASTTVSLPFTAEQPLSDQHQSQDKTRGMVLPQAFRNKQSASTKAYTEPHLGATVHQQTPSHHSSSWTLPPSPWFNTRGITRNTHDFLLLVQNAPELGLDPEWLHYGELTDLLSRPWNTATAKTMDSLLNSSFERYVTEISAGMLNPREVQKSWYQKPQRLDFEELLTEMIISPDRLQQLHRSLSSTSEIQLRTLKAIARYRDIESEGGWVQMPEGEALELGMSDIRVGILRSRLARSGDYPEFDTSFAETNLYDLNMQEAVVAFQQRHGLSADGVTGPATLRALNVSAGERATQLSANLERQRWMEDNPGATHIVTNIADYRMKLFENGEKVLDMPVVVGKYQNRTPVFSADMEHLVINPTWWVPKSITNNELLPKEQRDAGSLRRSGFEILRRDGDSYTAVDSDSVAPGEWHQKPFPYKLRQKAGKRNALGKVKFILPNPYSVYLHDTPSKSLFKRQRRAFSHGCVRLGDPRELANYLLSKNGWSSAEIDRAFQKRSTKTVHLDQTIPNHIVYLTAWADEDGKIQFREDIYNQDSRLIKALQKANDKRQQEFQTNPVQARVGAPLRVTGLE